jgi:hypothetical protein
MLAVGKEIEVYDVPVQPDSELKPERERRTSKWDLKKMVLAGERHGLKESKRETQTETKECRGWLQRTKKGTEQYCAQPNRGSPEEVKMA